MRCVYGRKGRKDWGIPMAALQILAKQIVAQNAVPENRYRENSVT